jgi:hypothetical protein
VISIYSTGFWLLVVLMIAGYFIFRKFKAGK